MKKFLISLAAALVLCIPALADVDPYFTLGPFAVEGTNSTANITFSSTGDVYFYMRSDGAVMAISEYSGQSINRRGYTDAGNFLVDDIIVNTRVGDYYSTIVLALENDASDYVCTPSVTSVPINSDIEQMFSDFLNGGGSTPDPEPGVFVRFNVPAGNVLYFKVDVEQDVTFTAVMPVLSSLIGTVNGAWNSGIEYGAAASLPSSGTTFPLASQDAVNFAKSASNQNLFGQTRNALAQKHCIANQYYALYCPYHYGGWLALGSSHVYPDGSVSGGVVGANVTVSGSFSEIKVYPLSEKANGSLLTGSVTLDSGSDDGFASYYDGEPNSSGGVTWLDQSGNPAAPSVGGTSYVPEEVSTQSIVEQIKGVLDNIISELKSLFSFGYEAIQSLTGLMQDFVSVFSGLYTWLPDPVYSALISAVVISIVIGVFKVFL